MNANERQLRLIHCELLPWSKRKNKITDLLTASITHSTSICLIIRNNLFLWQPKDNFTFNQAKFHRGGRCFSERHGDTIRLRTIVHFTPNFRAHFFISHALIEIQTVIIEDSFREIEKKNGNRTHLDSIFW